MSSTLFVVVVCALVTVAVAGGGWKGKRPPTPPPTPPPTQGCQQQVVQQPTQQVGKFCQWSVDVGRTVWFTALAVPLEAKCTRGKKGSVQIAYIGSSLETRDRACSVPRPEFERDHTARQRAHGGPVVVPCAVLH